MKNMSPEDRDLYLYNKDQNKSINLGLFDKPL